MNESTLVPREEMSDLDWLARNVHVWPYERQAHCYVMTGKGGKKELSASASSPFFSKLTLDQWLARRAELQNKPSFADHPDAKFLVQMSWGGWFKNKSDVTLERRGEKATLDSCGAFEFIRSGEVLGDWRDTLEKRPEQTIADVCSEVTGQNRHEEIFEPFVSVEDAKISILQSDGDVKHFGGIIGRNLPPEEDAATAKQPAPKGSGNPILGMVLADLTNRALEGKEKYGEPLLAHNGRNPLWDAYQEALDLAMYLRQAIEEQK